MDLAVWNLIPVLYHDMIIQSGPTFNERVVQEFLYIVQLLIREMKYLKYSYLPIREDAIRQIFVSRRRAAHRDLSRRYPEIDFDELAKTCRKGVLDQMYQFRFMIRQEIAHIVRLGCLGTETIYNVHTDDINWWRTIPRSLKYEDITTMITDRPSFGRRESPKCNSDKIDQSI